MLGDGSRGAVIEMTLAKVLYMNSKCLYHSCHAWIFKNLQNGWTCPSFLCQRQLRSSEWAPLWETSETCRHFWGRKITPMTSGLWEISEKPVVMFVINVAGHSSQSATVLKWFSGQVQLREYVKLQDTIYEVDPKEEECFRVSRVLNFKVGWTFTHGVFLPPRTYIYIIFSWREEVLKVECEIIEKIRFLKRHQCWWFSYVLTLSTRVQCRKLILTTLLLWWLK